MLKSNLCHYSDAYPFAPTVVGAGATASARKIGRNNRHAIFKNCVPYIDCITEINNTQVDNGKDLDVVMSII